MKSRAARFLTIATLSAMTSGCLTDEEIKQKIAALKGEEITADPAYERTLEGKPAFTVAYDRDERYGAGVSIRVGAKCNRRCWAQILRVERDGELVDEYAETAPQRAVGEKQDRTKTANGWAIDSDNDGNDPCYSAYQQGPFRDFPQTPNNDFGLFERLEVNIFETCTKCIDPKPETDWQGCVTWAYIKVKGDEVRPSPQRRLVSAKASHRPSPDFLQAERNWRNDMHRP
jgi:hypothetical protein